jgi:signal transduction histidine kinase
MDDRTDVIVTFPKEFPPQCFLDAHGKPAGFAIDLMNEIARLANLRVTYRPEETFVGAVNSLLAGAADIIPNSGITEKRLLDSDYTIPLETFEVVLFIRKSTHGIDGLDDLKGHKVAYLPTNVGEHIIADRKGITGVSYSDISSALFDLLAGRVDGFIYPKPVLLQVAREVGVEDHVKIAGKPLLEIKRGMRVRKGDKLLFRLNTAVETLLHSEEYKTIYTKWYGKPKPFLTPNKIVTGMTATLILLFSVMIIWRNRSLARINKDLLYHIAERKRIASDLQAANEELKGLDRMKSIFIATMSHELRTPLNSIIGFSTLVLDGLSGEINNKQREHLGRVVKASKRLHAMVSDIMIIANLEAGRLKTYPCRIVLKNLVGEAVEQIRLDAEKKGLLLITEIPADLALVTDQKCLLQCLNNLLSNAVKFSEQGTIRLTARQMDMFVNIFVEDTGFGMAPNDIVKIFEPFERLQTHVSVKAGGAGLGLYLTRKLVTEILHGEIEVESKEGKGSTFRLIIPLESNAEQNDVQVASRR